MSNSEGIQEDNEALPPAITLDEFNAVASQGVEESHTNRLKAQDNPEFKDQYVELLDDNDRVLYKDWHSDKAGVEFIGSEENTMMQDKGYEYMSICSWSYLMNITQRSKNMKMVRLQ